MPTLLQADAYHLPFADRPVNAIGAGLATLLAANEILSLILERRPAILAPDYVHVDLMDGVFIAQRTK